MTSLNRRRFLTIAAAAAATPAAAMASGPARWTGWALGGAVSMQLVGVDDRTARPLFAEVEAELARLEDIFSLYRTESELSRLNRDGALTAPSPELLEVLSLCDALNTASQGAFDPTIQPLWQALATRADDADLARSRAAVGWSGLRFDGQRIVLPQDGALTLNGIAQGAITDRIAALLRARGLRDVMVAMGEIAAMGHRADGQDWLVGIATPEGEMVRKLRLSDRALATSVPRAMRIGEAAIGHILNPQGQAARNALVSVSAPAAALADGLSTTLCLVAPDEAERIAGHFPGARIEALQTA